MKRLTPWLISRFTSGPVNPEDQAFRTKMGLLEGWISIVINTLLFFVKGGLGLMTGSVSLLADSVHTLSDSVTSVIVVLGFKISNRPADPRHPFGHGRMESIAGVVIGILLGVVAVEMFHASLLRLIHPHSVETSGWVIAVIVATILIKEALARFSFDLGRMIDSQALVADAWHHRSDVFATALVVVAFIGAYWKGLYWLDGAMGLGVSGMIAWAAYETTREAINPLLGEPASEETYQEIERIARGLFGVQGVHDILVHRYGPLYLISLHIQVSADQPALHLHEMCETIEARVSEKFPGHTTVHADPVDSGHKHYAAVKQMVAEEIAADPRIASYHDLRLVGPRENLMVHFDIVVRSEKGEYPVEELRAKVAQRLAPQFPNVQVTVSLEPPYLRSGGSV